MIMHGTITVAPEFPADLEWLNTARPLRLADLRGKVVLLNFWTYCSINCMHALPDLKRLQEKYPNELTVIGVHSAKFVAERETENLRLAVLRLGVEHPVVNDSRMAFWREFGASAWPTFVLIDPEGRIVGKWSGEGVYKPVDEAITALIKTYHRHGQLDRRPLRLHLEPRRASRSLLEFPGKVLANEATGQLFIADTGHNRVLVADLDGGAVRTVIGSGREGFRDGRLDEAEFNHPQGMALCGTRLYVADTGNHAIRAADLRTGSVTTIAGTGGQARHFDVSGPGRTMPLNSPWDLVMGGRSLFIAMAGSHQVWKMDLATEYLAPWAGTGREGRHDAALLASALAQPSGITADGKRLYIACSESSSIRAADLAPSGSVETIVGGDLFDFGDRDGEGLAVRLQHPMGVCRHDGVLDIADTYNHKIKRVYVEDRRCETLFGDGRPGSDDGADARFYEPGGLSFARGRLYVADTNNHAVRVVDLAARRVETLALRLEKSAIAPPPSLRQAAARVAREPAFAGDSIRLPLERMAPGDGVLTLAIELPLGYRWAAAAPLQITIASSARSAVAIAGRGEKSYRGATLPLPVPLTASEGKAEITVDLALYYCDGITAEKGQFRVFREVRLILPVEVDTGAKKSNLHVTYRVPMRPAGPRAPVHGAVRW